MRWCRAFKAAVALFVLTGSLDQTSPASYASSANRDPSDTEVPPAAPGEDRSELAEQALRLSPVHVSRGDRQTALERIEGLAQRVREKLPSGAEPRRVLETINDLLFREEGFRGSMALDDPKSLSLPFLLHDKQGTCVSLAILYLAVAQRVGLNVSAAATPVHLFVRYEGPEGVINVETLEQGRFLDDDVYRHRHRMADESIRRGVFMTALPESAVIAHFLSNRGVIYSKAGEHRKALRDFNRALQMYPDLVAAYYNRGLEYLRRGKFEKARADFTEAIDRHPLDAQAFNNRGLANLKLEDRAAAKRDFEEALRIEPGLKEAAQNLKLLDVAQAPLP